MPEDTEPARVTEPPVPTTQMPRAAEAVTNEAFHNSTIADINPSLDDQLVPSQKVWHCRKEKTRYLAKMLR